ncbi:MAG: ATP-binding protein [Firmicutes bacterium]|nr:ATP-binding protein [Candidatus Fermentithermobacillaceae bacterium]
MALDDSTRLGGEMPPVFEDLEDEQGWEEPEAYRGCVGRTLFDTKESRDNTVCVILPKRELGNVPSQSLVRIKSLEDGRSYVGVVTAGPFAEPDGIRGDTPLMVTTAARGATFIPNYHGRVEVEILGEENDGHLTPPRWRPRPNSPVFLLKEDEARRILKAEGDIALGRCVGYEMTVSVPSDRKDVFPRHTAVLGTTGSGKSTTIGTLVMQAQKAGMAVVILDVEGEYTAICDPATDPGMLAALRARGLSPEGVANTTLYHLVGRETMNPSHPDRRQFCLSFSNLSPYTVCEIMGLSEPQEMRFFQAYDVLKTLLASLRVFPRGAEDEAAAMEIDEMERGYPGMTLSLLTDVAGAFLAQVSKTPDTFVPYSPLLRENRDALMAAVAAVKADHPSSWRALLSKLWKIHRPRVFDNPAAEPIDYSALTEPGRVSIIDLSDTNSPILNNLVISDILRGILEAQDKAYQEGQRESRAEGSSAAGASPAVLRGAPRSTGRHVTEQSIPPRRTLVIIEEAHEFLSKDRISQMPNVFQQVARIARRGRKRWLGLVFVSQLPQHLPREILGLVNNFILHKITDTGVIDELNRVIAGVDASMWRKLPTLAPGQAVVSFAHMLRPILTAIDPARCRLRMVG